METKDPSPPCLLNGRLEVSTLSGVASVMALSTSRLLDAIEVRNKNLGVGSNTDFRKQVIHGD